MAQIIKLILFDLIDFRVRRGFGLFLFLYVFVYKQPKLMNTHCNSVRPLTFIALVAPKGAICCSSCLVLGSFSMVCYQKPSGALCKINFLPLES